MIKRNRKVTAGSLQLDLFDFLRPYEPTNLPDPIRIDGREPLAGVAPDDGERTGGERHIEGGAVRGAGDHPGRNGSSHPDTGKGATPNAATGPRSGVGDDPGEIYSPSTGRGPEPLNTRNYR